MQTGFNKSPDRIQSSLPPAEVIPPVLPPQAEGVEHEGRTRPVCIIEQPSESTIAIQELCRQLKGIQPTVPTPLSGRVQFNPALRFVTIDFFFKYVKAAAKAMEREVEASRELERTWNESEKEKKARQQQKCKDFWQQAEELFQESYQRIREQRKIKGEKR